MQDIAIKRDTRLNRGDSRAEPARLPVETVGHCQSVGNWICIRMYPRTCDGLCIASQVQFLIGKNSKLIRLMSTAQENQNRVT